MTSTSTRRLSRRTVALRGLTGTAAAAALLASVVNGPVAHAGQPRPEKAAQDRYVASLVRAHESATAPSQQDAYVASLKAAHRAATPYSVQDDYVRTLVFWHENPDWTPGA